jgi:hypothetical protein
MTAPSLSIGQFFIPVGAPKGHDNSYEKLLLGLLGLNEN